MHSASTIDGIEFHFSEDGSLDDVLIVNRAEFLAERGDNWDDDAQPSDAQIERYARDYMAREAWVEAGSPSMDPYTLRGLDRADFYYPRS